VHREAERVEGAGHAHPARVVGAVAGGGDDGAEAPEVDLRQRFGVERPGVERLGLGQPALLDRAAHELQELGATRVAPRDARRQVVGEADAAPVGALDVAGQPRALLVQRAQVQVVAAAAGRWR
jgi:hypothetical protein